MKKITGPEVGIIIPLLSVISSIIVIVMNVIAGENVTVGIGLLCSCTATISLNVRNKNESK